MNHQHQSVRFSCTALAGTGKRGILPKDADGYYTMPIGGLNVYNSVGDYYPYEPARRLFEESGSLMRRIKSGCLKGEYGHPKPLPGQSEDSFARRVMTIDEKNTCVHFSEVWLDGDSVKDEAGKPIMAIMAKLKPTGPYGPALAASLENPKEEVCFSIRAFTEDNMFRGVKQRVLHEVVVWDFVTEPGINQARKYKAPSLESYVDQVFTRGNVQAAMKSFDQPGIAMESSRDFGLSLIRSLGWNPDEMMPKFTKW